MSWEYAKNQCQQFKNNISCSLDQHSKEMLTNDWGWNLDLTANRAGRKLRNVPRLIDSAMIL